MPIVSYKYLWILTILLSPVVSFVYSRDDLCGYDPAYVAANISGSEVSFFLHPCNAPKSMSNCTSPACMHVGNDFVSIGSKLARFETFRRELYFSLSDSDSCEADGKKGDYETVIVFKCDPSLGKGNQSVVVSDSELPVTLCTASTTTTFHFEWSINDEDLCVVLELPSLGFIIFTVLLGLCCVSCFAGIVQRNWCIHKSLFSHTDNVTEFLWYIPIICSILMFAGGAAFGISIVIVMVLTFTIYKIILLERLDHSMELSDFWFYVISAIVNAFFSSSLLEEALKWFVIVSHSVSVEFQAAGISSGAFYGAAAGFGFASFENILYVIQAAAQGPSWMIAVAIMRILPMCSHIFYAWFMGLVFATHANNVENPINPNNSFVIPFVCHALWNFSLMIVPAVEIALGESVAEMYSIVVIVILIGFLFCFKRYVKGKIEHFERVTKKPVNLESAV
ncbi:hypothetical protein GEMRC1_001340 [Eukaryota sp. GEM-RC1]